MDDIVFPDQFEITEEFFLKWKSARFGDKNPTCFDNLVWESLVKSKLSAFQANEEMKGPSPFLYSPDVSFTQLAEIEDEYNVFRIEIQGVVVRYVEEMYHILVTVEGVLPNDILEKLKLDLKRKLSELENTKYLIKRIQNAYPYSLSLIFSTNAFVNKCIRKQLTYYQLASIGI